jgi:hypothetical protein
MYAASDHHVEVVVADGLIVKPLAPSIPEMQDRPRAGDVTLGGNTILADKMIQPRQEKWHQYMAAAEHNPEKYSKVVSIPAQNQGSLTRIVRRGCKWRRKYMKRSQMARLTLVNKYLHCFEGTILEVHEHANLEQ